MRNRPRSKSSNQSLYQATISANVSQDQKEFLRKKSEEYGIAMSRLGSLAMYNEFKKDKPFDFDFSIPEDEVMDYAYADASEKILKYIAGCKTSKSFDYLILIHEDMKIESVEDFRYGFKDLLDKNKIIAEVVNESSTSKFKVGTTIYHTKEKLDTVVNAKAKRIETAQKLLIKEGLMPQPEVNNDST